MSNAQDKDFKVDPTSKLYVDRACRNESLNDYTDYKTIYKLSGQNRAVQVWSLSSFKNSYQILTNDMNQVYFVSVLMTSSTALANKRAFELT